MKTVWKEKTMNVGELAAAANIAATNTVERKKVSVPVEKQPALQRDPVIKNEPVVESSQKAQSDSNFVEVGDVLPSKCLVYAEKSVAVRPFQIPEINKIHRAVVEKTIRHEIDAVSACLSMNAYQLTLGDFYWLMYWEYVNSYKKTPKTVTWRCSNEAHMDAVTNLELTPDTLTNVSEVKNSHLKEEPLDVEKVNAFAENFYNQYGLYLDLPRVSDLVETEDETNTDNEWYNKYAALISREHYGARTAQRREYLRGWFKAHNAPDVLNDFEDWAELVQHGVKEMITVTCKECGAEEKVELLVTPLSFLPASKRGNG